MGGVVFVFVREDASEAETLAEAFDAAGFSISGSDLSADALRIVLWSRHALRSHAFHDAAEQALRSGRAVVASLIAPPPSESVFGAPIIDLSAWDGEDSAALDPLFEAADVMARCASSNVIELPSRPAYEDAEFTEGALQLVSVETERVRRARQAWEAPIPDHMLRPTGEKPPVQEKLGAVAPRHDFRRLGQRRAHARVHAALAFAVLALIGGGLFGVTLAPDPAPPTRAVHTVAIEPGGVSLASASAEAAGLEDAAPVEAQRLFEPAPQAGRRGLEPPSARTIRRARYAPGDDRAAYRPPALIPDAIAADIERGDGVEAPQG
jgi:hypothetical protein